MNMLFYLHLIVYFYGKCCLIDHLIEYVGWPPTLFVWMSRLRAGVIALLVSMLEASFGVTSFLLCLESNPRALIRVSVFGRLSFMF
jgi:hypothetical protein